MARVFDPVTLTCETCHAQILFVPVWAGIRPIWAMEEMRRRGARDPRDYVRPKYRPSEPTWHEYTTTWVEETPTVTLTACRVEGRPPLEKTNLRWPCQHEDLRHLWGKFQYVDDPEP